MSFAQNMAALALTDEEDGMLVQPPSKKEHIRFANGWRYAACLAACLIVAVMALHAGVLHNKTSYSPLRPDVETTDFIAASSCDCSWIKSDDCKNDDDCANWCRHQHPEGPCGANVHAGGFQPHQQHQPPSCGKPHNAQHNAQHCDCGWIHDTPACSHEGDCYYPCKAANTGCFC